MRVYDIINAGENHRFMANGRIVSNCGRLLQTQNLPQNHLFDLDIARMLAKRGDAEMLKLTFGQQLPDILSQLIRTALIPKEGYSFVVADFSAIEARVIAWMAGEQWVLDTFLRGGDIYCQTASQMFKVPVEKHGVNSELRQKGKIAQLACIAEGQIVLTDHGEKPIETVTLLDRVWDGESWVSHEGVVCNGLRKVITYDGLTATEDHLVWVEGKCEPIRFGLAAAMSSHLLRGGYRGSPVRLGGDHISGETMGREEGCPRVQHLLCTDTLHELPAYAMDTPGQHTARTVEGLSDVLETEKSTEMAGAAIRRGEAKVLKSERCDVPELRRQGNRIQVQDFCGSRELGSGQPGTARQEHGAGQNQHEWSLRTRKHSLRNESCEHGEPTEYTNIGMGSAILAVYGGCGETVAEPRAYTGTDYRSGEAFCGDKSEELAAYQREVRVYDIRNAGKHHRYTVSGVLVHNCGYGGSTGAMINMGAVKMGLSEDELPEIVAKWRQANPNICALWKQTESAVKKCIATGEKQPLAKGMTARIEGDAETDQKWLTLHLPSGRKLFYARPRLAAAPRFPDRESIHYMGMNQMTHHWEDTDTHGGKLVENLVQAIARDVLCGVLKKLFVRHGLLPCFHVHDEVIIEVPQAEKDAMLETLLGIMAETPEWAEGLPLKGAGFTSEYYMKD